MNEQDKDEISKIIGNAPKHIYNNPKLIIEYLEEQIEVLWQEADVLCMDKSAKSLYDKTIIILSIQDAIATIRKFI